MKNKDSLLKKWQPSNVWRIILAAILTLGVMIGAHECIFYSKFQCYSSFFSYSALHFAILSFGLAFFSFTQSFIPQAIAAVAEIYPDANGKAKWHAQASFRLGAISNIGYSLVMLACGWMFPNGGGEVWQLFPAIFGIGLGSGPIKVLA